MSTIVCGKFWLSERQIQLAKSLKEKKEEKEIQLAKSLKEEKERKRNTIS